MAGIVFARKTVGVGGVTVRRDEAWAADAEMVTTYPHLFADRPKRVRTGGPRHIRVVRTDQEQPEQENEAETNGNDANEDQAEHATEAEQAEEAAVEPKVETATRAPGEVRKTSTRKTSTRKKTSKAKAKDTEEKAEAEDTTAAAD